MIEADHISISSISGRAAYDSRTGLLAAGPSLHRIASERGYLNFSTYFQGSDRNYGDVLACAGFSNGDEDGFVVVLQPQESGSAPQLCWFGADGNESSEDPVALMPIERFTSILGLTVAPEGNFAVVVGSDGEPSVYARGESQAMNPPPPWLPKRPSPSPVLACSFSAKKSGNSSSGGHWTALGALSGALCLACSTTAGAEVKTLTTQFDGPISSVLLHSNSGCSTASHVVVGGAQGWVAIVRLPGDVATANSTGSSESPVLSDGGYNTSASQEPTVELLHRDLGAAVTALTLHDVQLDGRLEVVAGTASGRIVALDCGSALSNEPPAPEKESNTSHIDSSAGSEDQRRTNVSPHYPTTASIVWQRDTLQPVLGLSSLGCSPSHGLPELIVLTADGASLYAPVPSVVAKKVATVAELAKRLTALRREAKKQIDGART